ncbi:MAG: MalY/PatB family protein, partial [Verrucomicrobiales bacterium]
TIYVSLAEDASGHYSFDREALEAAVRPDTGLFILCNPHNPVGRVYTREELEWLGDFCLRHDLLFCSDEVHCDLILDEESTPHISLLHLDPEIRDRSIVLMSASKTYNIAGIGCAFALIPDSKLRTAFRRAMGGWVPPVNVFGYTATEAAFCHGEPWRKALLVHLRNQHQILADYLSAHHPEVRLTKAEATYLAWTDVRGLGIAEPAAHFQKHGIALSNGADFGASGYLRWNLGCSSSMLEEGLRRFTDGCQTVH